MEIRGKKYKWRVEDMHPYLLVGLFGTSVVMACLSFWWFVNIAVALGE